MRQSIIIVFLAFLGLLSASADKKIQKSMPPIQLVSDSLEKEFIFHYYEGYRFLDENNPHSAKYEYLNCHKIHPEDPDLNAQLAIIYAQLDSGTISLAYMEKAHQLAPGNKWYSSRLLSSYIYRKNYVKALSVAEELHRQYPYNEDYFNAMISLYRELKQFDKALKVMKSLEKITGITEQTAFENFRLQMLSGKTDKALKEIEKLIRKFPSDSRYKVFLGDILIEQRRINEGMKIYLNVLKTDPTNPDVYQSLSEYYTNIDDSKHAMEYLMLSLKNPKMEVETKLEILGKHIEKLVRANTNIESTDSLFSTLTEDYPLEPQVFNYYAAFLIHLNKNKEAGEALETSLKLDKGNESAWVSLAQIRFTASNDSAYQVISEGLRNCPNNLTLLYFKGIALLQADSLNEALANNNFSLQLMASQENAELSSDFHAQNAEIYIRKNETDSAFACFENALKVRPDNVGVLNNYAYYLSISKRDLGRAESMSATTIQKDPGNSTFLDTYAWVFYQKGNYSLAKFYIERAIDNVKDTATAGTLYEHYGDILWMNGNNDQKALEMWKKAMITGAESDELRNKIEQKGWKR